MNQYPRDILRCPGYICHIAPNDPGHKCRGGCACKNCKAFWEDHAQHERRKEQSRREWDNGGRELQQQRDLRRSQEHQQLREQFQQRQEELWQQWQLQQQQKRRCTGARGAPSAICGRGTGSVAGSAGAGSGRQGARGGGAAGRDLVRLAPHPPPAPVRPAPPARSMVRVPTPTPTPPRLPAGKRLYGRCWGCGERETREGVLAICTSDTCGRRPREQKIRWLCRRSGCANRMKNHPTKFECCYCVRSRDPAALKDCDCKT